MFTVLTAINFFKEATLFAYYIELKKPSTINFQRSTMQFGILGSGSWGTALAKILTDNGNTIHWWNRSEAAIKHIQTRHHNPHYLSSAQDNKLYV